MTGILYKYRSLDNFKNFVDIILNNRLYAAKYTDMNDPMEGQYYYNQGELDANVRNKIKDEKGMLRICSLSREKNNELMWSHYTNGQRGVAIGVKIDDLKYEVKRIDYNGIAYIRSQQYNNQTATEILCHKLDVWCYEQEERVFVRGNTFINVQIEEVITGRAINKSEKTFIKKLVKRINPHISVIGAETFL